MTEYFITIDEETEAWGGSYKPSHTVGTREAIHELGHLDM